MFKRSVTEIFLCLFFVGLLVSGIYIKPVRAEPDTIIVPDDFTSIQQAINAANEGDIIYVRNGLYYEDEVVLNKTISLIGEDRDTTIIESQDGITITADEVTVREFNIHNSSGWQGILLRSSNCLITDNIIDTNHEGIFLDGRETNVTGNILMNNNITNNEDTGITIWNGENNLVENNKITTNIFGVICWQSSTNFIKRNEISDNSKVGVGIFVMSTNNTIMGNNITNNGWDEERSNAGISIILNSSTNHIILNQILQNKHGMVIRSNTNSIFHNSFINNFVQAISENYENIWDDGYPSGGNYWNDYTGVDLNGDNIGDSPYTIDTNNQDNYPLMNRCFPPIGDIDFNGIVNMADLYIAIQAFGSYPSHYRWNQAADIVKDDKIGLLDIYLVITNFGKTYS